MKVRKVYLEEMIFILVREVEPIEAVKGTRITREMGNGIGEAMMDSNAGRQVIGNILDNAIKFSAPGSEIRVKTRLGAGDKVEVVIADDGPGFTQEDKERMFQKYSRLSARPSAGEPSTGLGLFIVKSLVEEMGGRVRIEDIEGVRGASFVIEFKKGKL
ncbi:MAG: ATP-binding protein [Armatimonadetes bacterium]|nr:ATP-binding protein [Akkermansiaceae bacterium]